MSVYDAHVSEENYSDKSLWWKKAVVYQIYPRSFQDSNGDGIGDLRGILHRVDHLVQLGVDVVWLSPIYETPQVDNGYDVSDYQSIDPIFGMMEDFDQLIDVLHERGIKLIMDLVVNHTSDRHPWFIESRSSTNNPKRDWYWWRPGRPEKMAGEIGVEPTNWESFFSGSSWTLDAHTGEYYLHLFSAHQPDLNWENPELRQAIYKMMNWWLDRGIDGFRMDVINFISKNPDLPDGIIQPDKIYGNGFPHYASGPRLHEYLQEMRREVFAGRGTLLTVGETPGVSREEAPLFSDPTRGELDMIFQFEHVSLDHKGGKFHPRSLEPGELADSFSAWQEALSATGWNSLYLSNHDQPRAVSRFGDAKNWWRESATALATIIHLQRGTPYIYQGEEIGMTNATFSDVHEYRDVESLNYFYEMVAKGEKPEQIIAALRLMSRDHARTPMQWDLSQNSGFSEANPWISVNANYFQINAEFQYDDPESIFSYYRKLIKFRHELPVIVDGNFTRIDAGKSVIFSFERALYPDMLLVQVNLSSLHVLPSISGAIKERWLGAEQILSNIITEHEVTKPLTPWEARVYLK